MLKTKYSAHERIPMQYLIMEAAQDPTFAHDKVFGGAMVGCWIKNRTKKNARLISKGWIEDHGWVALSLEDQYPVSEADYKNKADGKEYFGQAQIDEVVFVFNIFPLREKSS
jgi:hypothetical protein